MKGGCSLGKELTQEKENQSKKIVSPPPPPFPLCAKIFIPCLAPSRRALQLTEKEGGKITEKKLKGGGAGQKKKRSVWWIPGWELGTPDAALKGECRSHRVIIDGLCVPLKRLEKTLESQVCGCALFGGVPLLRSLRAI